MTRETGVFYIATVDADGQPRVRPSIVEDPPIEVAFRRRLFIELAVQKAFFGVPDNEE